MNTIKYINIPINENANLRLRKDRIVATVTIPNTDHIDIYTAGVTNPWHISNIHSEEILNMIWEDDD